MISIDSGKLTIPEDERFIGIAGDNLTLYKEFFLMHHSVVDCSFLLALRFDDGTVRAITLSPIYRENTVLLTWHIRSVDLYAAGIVEAQVRITFPDGRVTNTNRDFFLVGASMEEPSGEYATRADLSSLDQSLHAEILGTESACKEYAKAYTDALAEDVYTKTEIDGMIGDLEDILAAV